MGTIPVGKGAPPPWARAIHVGVEIRIGPVAPKIVLRPTPDDISQSEVRIEAFTIRKESVTAGVTFGIVVNKIETGRQAAIGYLTDKRRFPLDFQVFVEIPGKGVKDKIDIA